MTSSLKIALVAAVAFGCALPIHGAEEKLIDGESVPGLRLTDGTLLSKVSSKLGRESVTLRHSKGVLVVPWSKLPESYAARQREKVKAADAAAASAAKALAEKRAAPVNATDILIRGTHDIDGIFGYPADSITPHSDPGIEWRHYTRAGGMEWTVKTENGSPAHLSGRITKRSIDAALKDLGVTAQNGWSVSVSEATPVMDWVVCSRPGITIKARAVKTAEKTGVYDMLIFPIK